MICAPYVGEEQAAIFEKVYYAVRYIFNEEKLKKVQFLYVHKKHSLNNLCFEYESVSKFT